MDVMCLGEAVGVLVLAPRQAKKIQTSTHLIASSESRACPLGHATMLNPYRIIVLGFISTGPAAARISSLPNGPNPDNKPGMSSAFGAVKTMQAAPPIFCNAVPISSFEPSM